MASTKTAVATGGGRPTYGVFTYKDDQRIHDLAGLMTRRSTAGRMAKNAPLASLRIVDRRNAYLLLPRQELTGLEVLQVLRDAVDPAMGPRSEMVHSNAEMKRPADPGNGKRKEGGTASATTRGDAAQHDASAPAASSLPHPAAATKRPGQRRKSPAKNEMPEVTAADLEEAGESKLRGLLKSRRKAQGNAEG